MHAWGREIDRVAACNAGVSGMSMLPDAARKLCLTDNAADNRMCRQRAAVDAGIMMGHSFGVGWGPNNTFIHPGKAQPPIPLIASLGGLEQVRTDPRQRLLAKMKCRDTPRP
jgi:hypothetical protein